MRSVIFSLLLLPMLFSATANAQKWPAYARNGMVVSTHHIASEVGLQILKSGGNAVDAAVATGFALAVVNPGAGNLGGGGFMMIRLADGTCTGIDYREKAPKAAHEKMYLDENGQLIEGSNHFGYKAVGVPGTVAGLLLALEKFGTMTPAEVLQPAIELAENGFPLSYALEQDFINLEEEFKQYPVPPKNFTSRMAAITAWVTSGNSRIWQPLSNELPKTAKRVFTPAKRRRFLNGK
jgi:gamma-glutamyltranspeptidase/glutathione hydrolase